ncbi:hypothetical protein [Prosthecobacter sp.]|uniref:hypothetical protein n=1 Tax=Prosthecobacter sp. TaxID=1965333 RepID=UPI0037838C12
MLAFHHGLGMSTTEVRQGHASEEHVAELGRTLQAIQSNPQSGNLRVICDGNRIEAKIPGGRFIFFTVEEGENGVAFLRCLRLACSSVLDESAYQRWGLDQL